MKKLSDFIAEVAEPLGGDEKRFKEKHVGHLNNDPNALEGNFVASTKKFYNLADYPEGMDKAVYESVEDVLPVVKIKLTHDKEVAARLAHEDEIRKKIVDESVVVPEGGHSDGDESHDEYKQKTAAAAPKSFAPPPQDRYVTEPEGGHSDGDESHDEYKQKTASEAPYPINELNAETLRKFYKRFRKAKLEESVLKSGVLTLHDGKTVDVSDEDADKITKLMKTLNKDNAKKMRDVLLKDKDGFESVVKFAQKSV